MPKPGGTLLLIGATTDRLEGQLIFGTLPGWWLGEEPERQTSPNAPLEMWDRALRETGFTDVNFEIGDYKEPGSCLHQGQRRRARPVLHPRRLRDHRILYSQALSSQCYARPPGGLASKWSPQTVLRIS